MPQRSLPFKYEAEKDASPTEERYETNAQFAKERVPDISNPASDPNAKEGRILGRRGT